MDAYEATSVVFSRIQTMDPENASKIMGFLLIQDHGEKEMIRLAFGPETLVQSVILKARNELGLSLNISSAPPQSTPPQSTPPSPSPFLSRTGMSLPPSLTIPKPSLASWDLNSTVFSDFQNPDDLITTANNPSFRTQQPKNGINKSMVSSISSPMGGGSSSSTFCNGSDLIDELQLQDHQLFPSYGGGDSSLLFPSYGGDAATWSNLPHRRSCSLSDICFVGGGSSNSTSGADDVTGGFGWKPCLYFARGYCKNGTSCRFLHGGDSESLSSSSVSAAVGVGSPGSRQFEMMDQCELLSSKCAHQQRLATAAQLMTNSFPYSPTKCINFLQHNDAHRALMMGEDMHKFGRSRLECSTGMATPSSRQIYLTFPADSTFREEDVSNYFSIYGPVQDVRIPYQQKRMFGFVTFIYPDTVKHILAKGNPHFVCDSRVLVKPYKEKGKVLDKYRHSLSLTSSIPLSFRHTRCEYSNYFGYCWVSCRKQQQQQQVDRIEFPSPCSTPTGLDSSDPLDLQLGARGFYNSQDMLWRRKLEEQADLQQALEFQGRRLMGLQLLDMKKQPFNNSPNLSAAQPLMSPTDHSPNIFTTQSRIPPSDSFKVPQENCSIPANVGTETESTGSDHNGNGKGSAPCEDSDLQESFEHNLPDSPFASPTNATAASVGESTSVFSEAVGEAEMNMAVSSSSATNDPNIASSLLLASSALDMASLKSCYFPMPRFPPSQETIEM